MSQTVDPLPHCKSASTATNLRAKRFWKRTIALGRLQRAQCRIFRERHNISQSKLAKHFGCTTMTIAKAQKNKYAKADVTEEDDEIVQSDSVGFAALLATLQKQSNDVNGGTENAIQLRQPVSASNTIIQTESESPKCSQPPATAVVRSATVAGIASGTVAGAIDPIALSAAAQEDILLIAFLTNVGLNASWLERFKNAGMTMEQLHRFAGDEEERIKAFVVETFPDMKAANTYFLVRQIARPF
ncbi:hypothetical protein R3P38DRAFT_3040220 [Favolaschia claudopus]|uniref:Uncharacterized protein n=1 Tax=Favolaschia claudopus TaxID=2862362 RepID=A0AAW0A9W5_9AGAR